jgi:hypothetical protein
MRSSGRWRCPEMEMVRDIRPRRGRRHLLRRMLSSRLIAVRRMRELWVRFVVWRDERRCRKRP